MRTVVHKKITDPELFKRQLLQWSQSFREVAFLDSNGYKQEYATYDCVLAADAFISLKTDYHNAFEDLKQLQQTINDWLFGYLSYDLKNDTEHLKSQNFDGLGFPDMYFFQPKKMFLLKGTEVEISYLAMCDDEIEADFGQINVLLPKERIIPSNILIKQRISKKDYLRKVARMLEKIHRGDIYEANFCIEFFAENATLHPLETYQRLNEISTPPFSVFFRNDKQFLMSASPERYLKKQGHKIVSQPIKGTAPRSADAFEDAQIRRELAVNEKERAENIMIVDLVRNDLSRTAAKGSVYVEELCGEYTFRQVHHLISTVVSELRDNFSAIEVLRTTFPMGSMTGAPKISAMQIIEDLEETKRGLYSGAFGYFTPQGNFDFSVVIRSILYNAEKKYVSFSVGSAITAQSDPEREYEECLLKAMAMRKVLEEDYTG